MEAGSSADMLKEMQAELGAELQESVAQAAERGSTEEELAAQLTAQLHETVAIAAESARSELREVVCQLVPRPS